MKCLIKYWGPVILLATTIFIQSCFPTPGIAPRFAFSDKMMHLFVYGILAILCRRALIKASPLSSQTKMSLTLIAIGMASLYGLSDEWHQSFVATRHGDFYDFLADFFGSAIGAVAHLYWMDRFNKADLGPG